MLPTCPSLSQPLAAVPAALLQPLESQKPSKLPWPLAELLLPDLPRCVPRTRGTAVRRGPGWGGQQGCMPGGGREPSLLCLPKSQRYLGRMARLGGCRWESCSWHCFPELLPAEQTPPGQLQVIRSSNTCSGARGVSRVRPCCSWGTSPTQQG